MKQANATRTALGEDRSLSRSRIVVVAVILAAWLAGCAARPGSTIPASAASLRASASAASVQAMLEDLDGAMLRAADVMKRSGLDGPEAREAVSALRRSNRGLIECAVHDGSGRLVLLDSPRRAGRKDADIGRLPLANDAALLDASSTADGDFTLLLQRSISSDRGVRIGTISARIRPAVFLAGVAASIRRSGVYDCWIMQSDGQVLYDVDEDEIGRNLLSDPYFDDHAERRLLGLEIARQESGVGLYMRIIGEYGQTVPTQCHWRTIGLHGAQWRLVIARPLSNGNPT